jgi:hypothetical protein
MFFKYLLFLCYQRLSHCSSFVLYFCLILSTIELKKLLLEIRDWIWIELYLFYLLFKYLYEYFRLLRPKSKKTPFLTHVPKRTRKGPIKDKKGPIKDRKDRLRTMRLFFADLFLKGQKGPKKTKNIKGTPLRFYTR